MACRRAPYGRAARCAHRALSRERNGSARDVSTEICQHGMTMTFRRIRRMAVLLGAAYAAVRIRTNRTHAMGSFSHTKRHDPAI